MIDWQVLLTPRSEDVILPKKKRSEDVSFITILSDLHDRVKHVI